MCSGNEDYVSFQAVKVFVWDNTKVDLTFYIGCVFMYIYVIFLIWKNLVLVYCKRIEYMILLLMTRNYDVFFTTEDTVFIL